MTHTCKPNTQAAEAGEFLQIQTVLVCIMSFKLSRVVLQNHVSKISK